MKLRYYLYLELCFRGAEVPHVDVRALDCRFFRYDSTERKILPVADFFLSAIQKVLSGESVTYLQMDDYLLVIENFKGNPSVIGFAAQGAVISAVHATGFRYVDKNLIGISGTTFNEKVPSYVLNLAGTRMYIPDRFNYPAIDFLLVHRINNGPRKAASIIPVQVTLNYSGHSKPEVSFFREWMQWVRPFQREDIKITKVIFVWVTPRPDSMQIMAENSLGFRHPAYTRQFVSFRTIDQELDRVLRDNRAYPEQKAVKATPLTVPPRPKSDDESGSESSSQALASVTTGALKSTALAGSTSQRPSQGSSQGSFSNTAGGRAANKSPPSPPKPKTGDNLQSNLKSPSPAPSSATAGASQRPAIGSGNKTAGTRVTTKPGRKRNAPTAATRSQPKRNKKT